MKFHYLLVDDLVGKEEFERRVEEKVAESGDLLDERTAAMLVVKDLGRAHIRIRDLPAASSLVCFFAKVLSVEEPREFERPDGTTGLVANVMVGDETGKARMTLWDEKAGAVHELEAGDVLEILGRPKGGGRHPDVTAVAVQEAACEISCPEETDASTLPEPGGDLEVRIIAVESPRTFTRRDGSTGEMVEAVIGNETGVFRLVAWAPAALLGIEAGTSVVIRGAVPRENDQGIEFSLGEAGSVSPSDREITVPMDTVADVEEGRSYSLAGTIQSIQPPHSFITRSGRQSSVRNLVVADEAKEIPVVIWGEKAEEHLVPGDRIEVYNAGARRGRYGDLELHLSWGSALVVLADETREIPVVIWGEKAEEHLVPGDRIEVYNAGARRGRYGDLELHLSWGSALVVLAEEEKEVEVVGTIIATAQGVCIDTGDACYLLAEPLPVGYEVRARGTVHRGVITISHMEAALPDPEDLQSRLDHFSGRP